MNQPDLPFDARTLARTDNPETSKAVAGSARDLRCEHHAIILDVIARWRYVDWTADEIARRCDLDRHQIGRRLGELERAGIVEKSGEKRPTDTGRLAHCYRVVPRSTN